MVRHRAGPATAGPPAGGAPTGPPMTAFGGSGRLGYLPSTWHRSLRSRQKRSRAGRPGGPAGRGAAPRGVSGTGRRGGPAAGTRPRSGMLDPCRRVPAAERSAPEKSLPGSVHTAECRAVRTSHGVLCVAVRAH